MYKVYHKELGQGIILEENNGSPKVKFDSGVVRTLNESELSQVIND